VRVNPWKNAGSHRAASFDRFERAAWLLALATLACIPLDVEKTRGAATAAKPAFVFGGVSYFHRWSQNDPRTAKALVEWSDVL